MIGKIVKIFCFFFLDEFKGHALLESARQADVSRMRKFLSSETINFKHPFTGDTAVVSLKRSSGKFSSSIDVHAEVVVLVFVL